MPESALTAIGQSVANTYDESRAVRAWVEQTGLARRHHPDRPGPHPAGALALPQGVEGHTAQIEIHAIQPKEYGVTNWWRHEEGLIAFQNEFLKSVYYHVKY